MKKWVTRKLIDFLDRDVILTEAVSRLFNTIGSKDILREENGQWFLEDKPIGDAKKKQLQAEAMQFLSTGLWKVLQTDVKHQANKKMFTESMSEANITAGKLWTYTLDCFRTRLESMNKGSGIFNKS